MDFHDRQINSMSYFGTNDNKDITDSLFRDEKVDFVEGYNVQDKYQSYTPMVKTPNGNMFVTIMENTKGRPVQIMINAGKGGAELSAWCDAFARITSRSLAAGTITINDLITELSGTTTQKIATSADGIVCRSSVEGIALALMRYKEMKFAEMTENLGLADAAELENGE